MSEEYVIETHDLTKVYSGKTVVDHVNMHIKKGSVYGFVGENGSGKTTIMRLIMSLANPSGGGYSLFGIDYKNKEIYKHRKNISAMVESASLVPTLSAYDNLKYACLYNGIKDLSIINIILDNVGLSDTGKKKVKDFSLGMRQRLGIGLLLLNNPQLLLLDEPMNGLDPEGIKEVRDLIISLNSKGITILISSHILSELEKVATDWGFISHGKLIKEISEKDLRTKCDKCIEIKYDDVKALLSKLSKIHLQKFEESGANTVRIYDEISARELLNKLADEGIEIYDIKTINTSVEEYYLALTKNGGDYHD